MFEMEDVLADLIRRIQDGELAAFEEFGRLLHMLLTFFLLGSGVGLHGREAAKWVDKSILTIAASGYAATAPYFAWLERQFEDLLHREFFHDAARIQNRIMCELPPLPPGVLAHAVYRPRQRVSGDLILAVPSGEEVWFAVGDVTGHGTAAAVYATCIRHVLQMAPTDPEIQADDEPLAAAARKVNRTVLRDKTGNVALPVIWARVILRDSIIEVLNCGSPATPFLLRNGSAEPIDDGSVALGYFPALSLPIWRRGLEHGDVLILPTDGLVEQTNADGHMYSNHRLGRSLETTPSWEPRPLADHIFDSLDNFAAGSQQSDDQSLLVIRFGI